MNAQNLDVLLILSGSAERVPNTPFGAPKTLFIFDKDGTLVFSTTGKTPNSPREQYAPPDRVEIVKSLKNTWHEGLSPVVLAIASNQGGIEWGFLTPERAVILLRDVDDKYGNVFDAVAFCGHKSNCFKRKPNPGMLLDLYELYKPERVVVVGDTDDDRKAAMALKDIVSVPVVYVPEKVFFKYTDVEWIRRLLC